MALRISVFVALLFSVIFLPFWFSAILALGSMIYFPKYYEAPVLFFLSDVLYGAPVAKFSRLVFVSFFASLAMLFIIETLKKKLRYYP